ncbi:MAG: DNRLRE domain-containing protein [Clostridia bacterium]|nr:DNRLRE domain-containing protein [Clostridia bacterium]
MRNRRLSVILIMLLLSVFLLLFSTTSKASLTINSVRRIDCSQTDNKFLSKTSSHSDEMLSFDQEVESCRILDYVDQDDFNSNNYLFRVKDHETLNTYVFQRSDGQRTVYFFDENIKFIGADGIVREKNISLQKIAGGFTTIENDVDVFLPDFIENGLRLEYNNNCVCVIPNGIKTDKCENDESAVFYNEVFGENTVLKYTPTLSGLKEDIILYSSAVPVDYSFTIFTNGMHIYSDKEGSYIANENNATESFRLGNVVLYDSAGHQSIGQMEIETVSEGKEYLVTITIDRFFLENENTVFPVTIDPTFTVSDNTHGANAIQDAPIFQNLPDMNFGFFLLNRVGKGDNTYGVGRTVVKLSGFTSSNEYIAVNASQISSVIFYAREASGGSNQSINLHPITGVSLWTESNVTWNTISNNFNSSANFGASMANGQWTSFDITNLVKGWKNGTYSADCGFIMKNSNESNDKCFDSCECSTTSNRPYVTMTYEPTIQINSPQTYTVVGGYIMLSATTNPALLPVTWTSSNTSIATVNGGLVIGISEGSVTITATYTDLISGGSYSDSVTVNVWDSVGIKDNTYYYIMNYSSHRYLTLETASDSDNINVCVSTRGSSAVCRWKTEKQLTNGKYQLINGFCPSGRVLNVTNSNIDIYTDNNSSTQQFYIYRINTGPYKGLYYIRYGNYYVAQDSYYYSQYDRYDVYLTSSFSSRTVWSFMVAEQRSAEMYCHDYYYIEEGYIVHFDTSVNSSYFNSVCDEMGYTSNSYENSSSTSAYSTMKNSDDIFVFMGHGGSGRIAFYTTGNIVTGRILANSNMPFSNPSPYYISDLSKNELCANRCVLYLGCSTGTDYEIGTVSYNIVDATYEKGAHFVLGTTEILYDNQLNDWIAYFLDALSEGMNISAAIISANDELGTIIVPYYNPDGTLGEKSVFGLPSYYAGDRIQYLDIN